MEKLLRTVLSGVSFNVNQFMGIDKPFSEKTLAGKEWETQIDLMKPGSPAQ